MLRRYFFLFWCLFVGFDAFAGDVCADKYHWIYLQPAMMNNPILEGNANLGIHGNLFNIEFISDKQQVDSFRFDGTLKKNSKLISGELIPPNTEIGFIRFQGKAESQLLSCAKLPKSLWLVDDKNGGYIFLRKF